MDNFLAAFKARSVKEDASNDCVSLLTSSLLWLSSFLAIASWNVYLSMPSSSLIFAIHPTFGLAIWFFRWSLGCNLQHLAFQCIVNLQWVYQLLLLFWTLSTLFLFLPRRTLCWFEKAYLGSSFWKQSGLLNKPCFFQCAATWWPLKPQKEHALDYQQSTNLWSFFLQ